MTGGQERPPHRLRHRTGCHTCEVACKQETRLPRRALGDHGERLHPRVGGPRAGGLSAVSTNLCDSAQRTGAGEKPAVSSTAWRRASATARSANSRRPWRSRPRACCCRASGVFAGMPERSTNGHSSDFESNQVEARRRLGSSGLGCLSARLMRRHPTHDQCHGQAEWCLAFR